MQRLIFFALLLAICGPAAGQSAEDCPTDALLDVSKYPGAGEQYAKPKVEGGCEGDQFIVRSNGIPHYQFVQITPGPLVEQQSVFRVPRTPELAEEPTSLPFLGRAGFAVNGIAFFGPNEGPVPAVERYGDPIYNSIMDECMGHTANEYHYHAFYQPCLAPGTGPGSPSPVLGFALDGFKIYGPYGCADADCRRVVKYRSGWDQTGDPSINAWDAYTYQERDDPERLDRCNGHTGPLGDYHYHSTDSFPYIIGCYSGTPALEQRPGGPPDLTQNRGRRGGPGDGARRGGPGPRARRGGPGDGLRPGVLERAAETLELPVATLEEALGDINPLAAYLRDPESNDFDFETAAQALGVNSEALQHAFEHQVATPVAYRGHRPGCTVTAEGYLLCHPSAVQGLVDQVKSAR
jgi:hypothetical protein